MSIRLRRTLLGELRPSQLLYTYGVGAIVDLPGISTMVMGLDDWEEARCREIGEPRLLTEVRRRLGNQVEKLVIPPSMPDRPTPGGVGGAELTGVPVAPFPRYMRCPACDFLAPLDCGLFELKTDPYRPDRARIVHVNCARRRRPPDVVPARFLVTCEHGHLDDFPWVWFVHRGPTTCKASLQLREYGVSGEAAEIEVRCTTCGVARRMSDAVGDDNRLRHMPACRGRRPHLRDFEEDGCTRRMKTIVLGASNLWFPIKETVLSLPGSTDALDQLVEEAWTRLQHVTALAVLQAFRAAGDLPLLAGYDDDEVWEAIERRRAPDEEGDDDDLLAPEWALFADPEHAPSSPDFRLHEVAPPAAFSPAIASVVQVERVREVTALIGFARIESPRNYGGAAAVPGSLRAPLSRSSPAIVPAAEVRGEGLFVRFDEEVLQSWLGSGQRPALEDTFLDAHTRWRAQRGHEDPAAGFPGMRYLLLHSFSHALMRQLALECGYSAASIRERIYARDVDDPQRPGQPMAGVLLYTAAPDSEGTLGGLVRLAEPRELQRHLTCALEAVRLCASDPLCADHHPVDHGVSLHGAACHACLFAPETSCERGNQYLDRTLLVDTVNAPERAFFPRS